MNDLLTNFITLQGAQQPSCAQQLFPFAIMIFIFYFIVIRPQQNQEKARQEMLSRLKRGDTVITSGGLIGKIDAVSQSEIKLELADKVRVRVAREDVELYTANETDQ